jgi:DNA polymerase-1
MERTLLIDGDILLYQISSSTEEAYDWGDDIWTLHGDVKEAKEKVDVWIADIKDHLEATHIVITLTDHANWRKDVLPTYKHNRKSKRKPLVFPALRDYAAATYKTELWETLEADDVMGILSTNPTDKTEKIIVSEDKDMKTIPGLLYNPGHPEDGIVDITLEQADRTHLTQALTGDATDGYSGCPGVGPKTAIKVLKDGDWIEVVAAYEKAGLTEEDALIQARVARILRHGEYNKTKKEVKLWTPKCHEMNT